MEELIGVSILVNSDNIVEFRVVYSESPGEEQSVELNSSPSDALHKVSEKTQELSTISNELHSVGRELYEEQQNHQATQQRLSAIQFEFTETRVEFEAAENEKISLFENLRVLTEKYRKVLAAYREKMRPKSPSESVLAQMEQQNKILIRKTVQFEKEILDQNKKLKQYQKLNSKLQEELKKDLESQVHREAQVKRILTRVKAQENEINKLKEDITKRDLSIVKLKKIQENATLQPQQSTTQLHKKQLEEALKIISDKDREISVMKDMVRSSQTQYKHREIELSRYKKTHKFPPISNQSSAKLSEGSLRNAKHVKFHQTEERSTVFPELKFKPESDNFLQPKARPPTPPSKQFFNPEMSLSSPLISDRSSIENSPEQHNKIQREISRPLSDEKAQSDEEKSDKNLPHSDEGKEDEKALPIEGQGEKSHPHSEEEYPVDFEESAELI